MRFRTAAILSVVLVGEMFILPAVVLHTFLPSLHASSIAETSNLSNSSPSQKTLSHVYERESILPPPPFRKVFQLQL